MGNEQARQQPSSTPVITPPVAPIAAPPVAPPPPLPAPVAVAVTPVDMAVYRRPTDFTTTLAYSQAIQHHVGIMTPAPLAGLEEYITYANLTKHVSESLRYRWIEMLTLRSWRQILRPIPTINYTEQTPVFWSIQHNRSKFDDHRLIYRIAGPIKLPSSVADSMNIIDKLLSAADIARGIAMLQKHGHPLHRTCLPEGGSMDKLGELKTFRVVVINADKERSTSSRNKRQTPVTEKKKHLAVATSSAAPATSSKSSSAAAAATATATAWGVDDTTHLNQVKEQRRSATSLMTAMVAHARTADDIAAGFIMTSSPASKSAGPLETKMTSLATSGADPRLISPPYSFDVLPPPIVLPWNGLATPQAPSHRQAEKRARRKTAAIAREHGHRDGDSKHAPPLALNRSDSNSSTTSNGGDHSYAVDTTSSVVGLADLPLSSPNVCVGGTHEWLQRVPTSAFASKIGKQIQAQTGWTASLDMDDHKHLPPADRSEWVVYIEGEHVSVGVTLVCQNEANFARDFFCLSRLNEVPDLLAKGAKLLGRPSHPHYERAWWELHRNMMIGKHFHHMGYQQMADHNQSYGNLSATMTTMTNNERQQVVAFGLNHIVDRMNATLKQSPVAGKDCPHLFSDAIIFNDASLVYLLCKRLKPNARLVGILLARAFSHACTDAALELLRYIFACPFTIDALFSLDFSQPRYTHQNYQREQYTRGSHIALPFLFEAAVTGGGKSCMALALDIAYFVLRTSYHTNNNGKFLTALRQAWMKAQLMVTLPTELSTSSPLLSLSSSSSSTSSSSRRVKSKTRILADNDAIMSMLLRIPVPYDMLVRTADLWEVKHWPTNMAIVHSAFKSIGSFYDDDRTSRRNRLRESLLEVAVSVASRDTLTIICDYMLNVSPIPRLFPPSSTSST